MQFEQIEDAISMAALTLKDVVKLTPRPARTAPLPAAMRTGKFGAWLANEHPGGEAWLHQSRALDHLCQGRNVVVATGTASGKSRIYQYAALHAALESDRRTLVLYPVKALAADQQLRWQKLIDEVGLPSSTLAKIVGGDDPAVRESLLNGAIIALMTPDVCHAWLMRKLEKPGVLSFLRDLQYVVLDEAHVYDGIFGSNTAFMLRRLISARNALFPTRPPLQFIVTTATIQNPAAHMEQLVGLPFELVGEADDGSPTHDRRIYLATSSDLVSKGEAVLSDLLARLAPVAHEQNRRIIAFHDSRQGTERVAMQVSITGIHAYRSGYEETDRAAIEKALRTGDILGIVSTSAMELGIDIPDLDIGINLGIPRTRKRFRQRFGRVGRSGPGAFLLLTSEQAIKDLPGNLAAYVSQEVEPSHLYLENRFMQFAQACCMLKEIGNSFKPASIVTQSPGNPVWPPGFVHQLENAALPRQQLDPVYHHLAGMAGHDPHLSFPLRLLGERNFELVPPGSGKAAKATSSANKTRIGNISLTQALREAYPGGTYRHLEKYYRVKSWNEKDFQPKIVIERCDKDPLGTSPVFKREISFGRDMVIDERLLRAPGGFVAESELIVVETVLGYEQQINGQQPKAHLYRANNRKKRQIPTTGVVIAIDEDLIDEAQRNAGVLHALGDALKACFIDRHDIEPGDVELSVGECALVGPSGPQIIANSIVIYDAAYGGMRLTEKLFDDFLAQTVLKCLAQIQASLPLSAMEWMSALKIEAITSLPAPTWPDHRTSFFGPDSVVTVFDNGSVIERHLGSAVIKTIGGSTQLYYQYSPDGSKQGGIQLVPAAMLLPGGHQWTVMMGQGAANDSPGPTLLVS